MKLSREEIGKIYNIVTSIPNVDTFEITTSESNGIGYTVNLSFEIEYGELIGTMTVPVTTVEDW